MPKPLPILSEMPRIVLEKIIEKLDFFERHSLKKCSKRLQTIVTGTKKIHYQKVELILGIDEMIFKFHDFSGKLLTIRYHNSMDTNVSEFLSTFSSPKTTIGVFCVIYQDSNGLLPCPLGQEDFLKLKNERSMFWNIIGLQLKQKKLKGINVSVLDLSGTGQKIEQDVVEILQIFSPETVQGLILGRFSEEENLPQLTAIEHWKNATWVDLSNAQVPMEKLAHFTGVIFREHVVTLEEFTFMVEAAKKHGDKFIKYEFHNDCILHPVMMYVCIEKIEGLIVDSCHEGVGIWRSN